MTKKIKSDRPTGQWIRSDLRLAIYLRDEFHCVYCGKNLHGVDPFDITLDHIKPFSMGGSNNPSNLITACRYCNCARGAKLLSTFDDECTRKSVLRQSARKIDRYRKLAKSIIAERSDGFR